MYCEDFKLVSLIVKLLNEVKLLIFKYFWE